VPVLKNNKALNEVFSLLCSISKYSL